MKKHKTKESAKVTCIYDGEKAHIMTNKGFNEEIKTTRPEITMTAAIASTLGIQMKNTQAWWKGFKLTAEISEFKEYDTESQE